jgi:hypothetical protein
LASSEAPLGGLMMERFPTWHVWRLLHTYPRQDIIVFLRLLRVKTYTSWLELMHNAWAWTVLSLIVTIAVWIILGNSRLTIEVVFWVIWLVLSLFVTFDSLSFALRTVSSISKWHRLGGYDLFALLPAGEFGGLLNVCRTHRAYLNGTIRGVLSLVIVILGMTALAISLNAQPASFESGFGFIFVMMVLFVLLTGLWRLIDYVQSLVSATLIALFVNRHHQREARMRVISGFLGMQFLLYGGVLPLLITLPYILLGDTTAIYRNGNLYFIWLVVFTPSIFIAVRELINFALWQAVKRRLEAE